MLHVIPISGRNRRSEQRVARHRVTKSEFVRDAHVGIPTFTLFQRTHENVVKGSLEMKTFLARFVLMRYVWYW